MHVVDDSRHDITVFVGILFEDHVEEGGVCEEIEDHVDPAEALLRQMRLHNLLEEAPALAKNLKR